MSAKRLTLQQRKDIFRTLTELQDEQAISVAESRRNIIQQFDITDEQLREIEDEGTDKDWPPLNEAFSAAG